MNFLAASNIGVLWWKPVTMDGNGALALRVRGYGLEELQAGEAGPLVPQLLVAELAQAEVLPPHAFVLAPVEVEDVGEEPPCLLLGGPDRNVSGNAGEQLLANCMGFLAVDLLLVGRVAGSRRGPVDSRPGSDPRRALAFEPVAERARGEAVVLVVGLDLGARLRIDFAGAAQLQGELDDAPGRSGVLEGHAARVGEEGFQVLDGVVLDARAERLANDGVEIDEDLAAQETIDLFLARRVAAHEALQRGGLVRGVVIDVHARITREACDHEVDEVLEGRLLGLPIDRPECSVLALVQRVAEEVFEAAVRDERIALDVEEDVARRWFGKQREAPSGLKIEVLLVGSALEAAGELDPRLLARAGERLGATAPRFPEEWKRYVREARERRDVSVGELAPLQPCDPRDEGKMVGVVAFLIAAFPEAAGVALLHWLGHRERQLRERLFEGGFEPALHPPVVGEEVVNSEG